MKRLLFTLIAVVAVSPFARATGTLPTYENFDYPPGFDLGTQSTNVPSGFIWTHTGTTAHSGTINVAGTNLSYAGLATSAGNSITNPAGPSQGLRYHSAGTTLDSAGVPLYYSVIFQVNSLGTLGTGGVFLFSLNNTSQTNQGTDPTSIPGRIWARASTTSGKFNVGLTSGFNASGQPTPTWSPTDFSPGDTIFVVLKYTFITTSTSASEMWVNPLPSEMGSLTPSPSSLTNTAGTQAQTVQSLLVINTSANAPLITADEIRIGTNYAAVTPPGPPGFTNVMPASQTVNYGATVVLSSGAAGPGSLSYVWRKNNGSPLTDTGGYSGSSTATLTITGANASHSGGYTVTATSNPYGSSTSSVASVTVNDPYITSQPTGLTLPPGADAVFTVAAAGSGTVTYQWKKGVATLNNGATGSGSTVSGATTASLTVHTISSADADTYSVLVSGAGPSVLSTGAVLTVINPAIISNPTNLTVNYNVSAAFHVKAAGTQPITYRWQKEGVDLTDNSKYPGNTTSNLTITGSTYLDAGNYQVLVTNGVANSVTSSVAVLTVIDPFFISQPSSQTVSAGGSVAFSVTASGSGVLTYQWRKVASGATNDVTDGPNVTGSMTSMLSLSNLSTNDSGNYFVVVTGGQVNSSSQAALAVIAPPGLSVALQSRTVAPGDRVVFIGTVAGTGPFGYTWRKNGGSPLPVPSTNYLVLTNVSAADIGIYSLVVSNFSGSATNSATLSVVSPPLRLFPTNLVVLRVGDGLQTLGLTGNSVYLDQFTPSGSYVNTISLPESGSNAFIMTGGGSTFTDCQITRSWDGTYLSMAGYATNLNSGFSLQAAGSSIVPRGVATVDASGSFVLARVSKTAYSGIIFRSAATDGANNFWGSGGNNGTYYFGNGANPATTIQSVSVDNTRVINVFSGDLYFSTALSAAQSIWKFSGLPVSSSSPTVLFLINNGSGIPSPMAFAISPDTNTVYVADDRANGSGGILRYDFDTNSSSWNLSYNLDAVTNVGVRGITADFSGPNPILYATTAENTHSRFISITDSNSAAAATTLSTSGDNQLYRSLAFGPTTVRLNIAQGGGQVTLLWPDPASAFTLECKTNLNDPSWTPVGVAPTPANGTNSVTLPVDPSQKSFRLRKP